MNNHLIKQRLVVAKSTGFVMGLLAFFSLWLLAPEISSHFKWGLLFWYTTVGAIIGLSGTLVTLPLLNWPLSRWVRAGFMGAWLNLVLLLVAYNTFYALVMDVDPDKNFYVSPYWFVLEGALVGLIIEFITSKFAKGEDA